MNDFDIAGRVEATGKEISLTREPSLARRLVQTYDPDLYPTEQDCWRESGRRRIEQVERGTTPETIFESLREMVANHGGALPVVLVNDKLAVATDSQEEWPLLGLDEEERMELSTLSRSELVDRVSEDIREASVEELADLIEDEAGRDVLLRMAAAFLQKEP